MSISSLPGSDSHLELPRMLKDPIGFLTTRHRKYGDVFKTRFIFPVVFALGPEANKTIHVTQRAVFSYEGAYSQLAFARLFEGSLLLEDGEKHQHDRDLLQPAMGRLALGGSLQRVRELWEAAAGRLAEHRPVDPYQFALDTTFEVSANVLLGLAMDDVHRLRPLFERVVRGVMASTKLRIPFGRVDRGLSAREELISAISPRIEAAREGPAEGMLGLLARATQPDGTPLTTRRIAEHLLLLFWAGYDTTASSGSWALVELARAPEWQQRLADEQRAVLGDGPATLEAQLPQQGYVLKEIERLRPAALFFPRKTTAEVVVASHRVPTGTMIFYSPYRTHRIESLFPEPERFLPERWSPQQLVPGSTTALVGFGGGPRICLGKAFALMQLRVMLCTLLRLYRWEVDPSDALRPLPLPIYRPDRAALRFRRIGRAALAA